MICHFLLNKAKGVIYKWLHSVEEVIKMPNVKYKWLLLMYFQTYLFFNAYDSQILNLFDDQTLIYSKPFDNVI